MKQNFQLHYFYGENENAVRTQVWCTLIAQLLRTFIRKIAQTRKAFLVVAALVRMYLISMLDVSELLRNTNRGYQIARESPEGTLQLALFSTNMGGILKTEKQTPYLWAIQKKNYRLLDLVG